jgi:hypothetical protein
VWLFVVYMDWEWEWEELALCPLNWFLDIWGVETGLVLDRGVRFVSGVVQPCGDSGFWRRPFQSLLRLAPNTGQAAGLILILILF